MPTEKVGDDKSDGAFEAPLPEGWAGEEWRDARGESRHGQVSNDNTNNFTSTIPFSMMMQSP